MTVTDVHKDLESATMTITTEFDAPVERVWQLWADPRLLERWWGPPTYPATFVDHDLVPGGTMTYYMTSPEGDRFHGWWRISTTDEPKALAFEDGFADSEGNQNDDLPTTRAEVRIEELSRGRTRMTIESSFPSTEAMQQLMEMGMEEGLRAAMGQIDGILAAS
jgi:uncharacterized protein YndB with AHSA1/START domain